MNLHTYSLYLLVMAGVTYLLRAVPFVLLKKEIQSPFWKSFLTYIPYTVLSSMTVPYIFYATESTLSAVIALATAVVFSLLGRGLVLVAVAACVAVLLVDGLIF
ncbi:MAG: AzlD domain-containing protein [Fibrobacteraceae bacterium]|nr:AzlD domain-containing protein [Fibrobacteraceae bacterium]